MASMQALVFKGPGQIELRKSRFQRWGRLDALICITTTTICGTDVHILKGEYPRRRA